MTVSQWLIVKTMTNIQLNKIDTDEDYSRNAFSALNWISAFLVLNITWDKESESGLLIIKNAVSTTIII